MSLYGAPGPRAPGARAPGPRAPGPRAPGPRVHGSTGPRDHGTTGPRAPKSEAGRQMPVCKKYKGPLQTSCLGNKIITPLQKDPKQRISNYL